MFDKNDLIYAYTRQNALDDGFQVDANIGDFAEITAQYYKVPVYMTNGVFSLIGWAVNNKN